MFVNINKTLKMSAICIITAAVGATTSAANPAQYYKVNDADVATIPVTVELGALQVHEAPLYVSIQKRDEYMGIHGYGGVIQAVSSETMSATFKVDTAGDYAVSVWHDLNNDGVFSMDDNYQILDGWGASGNVPVNRRPKFEDVMVKVETYGATVPVMLKYPSK
ncbi:MAG: DUF2141 domain-containing protein [Litorimonas sp.]